MAIEQSFELPMTGAEEFWRGKVQLGKGAFNRLSDEAKLRAFAISGIAKGDELNTVFTAIRKAIENGESFEKFKKECREIFERRGWEGKRAWRVDNIFRTNIQTAYNVGHYEQLEAEKDVLPYWQYSAVNDRRTRPTHLAMNGRVWPTDHPIWQKWFPPNGYRCRCSVIGLTKSQVENRGVKVEEDDPTDQPIMGISSVTGREELMPRQLIPDPGFEMNPGKMWQELAGRTLSDRLEGWHGAIAAPVLKEILTSEVFSAWYKKPAGNFPVGKLAQEHADAIGAKTRAVNLSEETARKQQDKHPEIGAKEYRYVQETIEQGQAIKDGDNSMIFLLEKDSYVTVIKSTKTGKGVFVTSFRRLSQNEAKRDAEIRRLLGKEK